MPRRAPRASSNPDRPQTLQGEQQEFIDAYAKTGNVTLAARICGQPRHAHYGWIKREKAIATKREEPVDDYPYHAASAAARDESVELLEAEARRRAERGVRKYKFYGGKPIYDPETNEPYYEIEYDTALLIFLLKALHPERYRDRTESRKAGNDQAAAGRVAVYVPENNREPRSDSKKESGERKAESRRKDEI